MMSTLTRQWLMCQIEQFQQIIDSSQTKSVTELKVNPGAGHSCHLDKLHQAEKQHQQGGKKVCFKNKLCKRFGGHFGDSKKKYEHIFFQRLLYSRALPQEKCPILFSEIALMV